MPGDPPTARLYRVMKDGDATSFRRMLDRDPGLARRPAEGSVASPLISAVWCGRLEFLEALLAAGADPDRRDESPRGSSWRLRALEASLWMRRDEPAWQEALLAAGATPDWGTDLFRRDVEAVRAALDEDPARLAEAYIQRGYTLLHVAANLDGAALVRLLIERGLDPDAGDGAGHPPLRYAARNAPAIDVMEALVEGGADVNRASRTGVTALTSACRHARSAPAVRWLLEHGADPSLVPSNRVSALMKAAGNRASEIVELLLAHGADPAYRGANGETALDVARRRRADEVVALLGG